VDVSSRPDPALPPGRGDEGALDALLADAIGDYCGLPVYSRHPSLPLIRLTAVRVAWNCRMPASSRPARLQASTRPVDRPGAPRRHAASAGEALRALPRWR